VLGQVLERRGQREELAERIPAQVVLPAHELLHVLGRRAAGAGLEQAAARHQRHDRQHLGAGAELEDREQVGQVVAQHVAGDRDRVLALADALERERIASTGAMIGCRGPWCRGPSGRRSTLAMTCASWARVSSSQNTAGVPEGGRA
jgi:hypothetical protein